MDTCIRKPLIVTCSTDKTIKVWNFIENSNELVKSFPEEAYSVAIHPSGMYILVGFSDKLRLMNLLIDDIRTYREFTIRGCREVTYFDIFIFFTIIINLLSVPF
jgi:WD40 repeat protein